MNKILKSGQKGMSSVYIIILIMTIYLAVMLSGGSASLFSGNIGSPVSPTPTPSTSPSTSTSPTTTVSPNPNTPQWSISYTFLGCNINGLPRGIITTSGSNSGYINYEIKQDDGTYKEIATGAFIPTSSIHPIVLLNKDGFNVREWRINLFDGGQQINETWIGGVLKITSNHLPTMCNNT